MALTPKRLFLFLSLCISIALLRLYTFFSRRLTISQYILLFNFFWLKALWKDVKKDYTFVRICSDDHVWDSEMSKNDTLLFEFRVSL